MLDPQLLLSLLPPVPLNDFPVVKFCSSCLAAVVGCLRCICSLGRQDVPAGDGCHKATSVSLLGIKACVCVAHQRCLRNTRKGVMNRWFMVHGEPRAVATKYSSGRLHREGGLGYGRLGILVSRAGA